MFKLESYIAPILLSYVDKYIKNFRLEDSQVSLWGGDAIFQNLDLRLEVLEQELQSPFSFISGHIKELSIHVPWTKLTSEPITITINTIECVLKLKDSSDGVASDTSPLRDKSKTGPSHKGEDEAPPNYVQLLINKIVSNIRILCNNLILKYVEEDIVLSMNVKHLKVESCNDKWESAYSDISPTQVVMRKIIGVNDLTVCLDKRNATGKIDFYQEPMLYRCSMTMHLLRTYNSSTANKTSLTRLDIYCNNMEFSMTEQQVSMFMRLVALIQALNQKQLRSNTDFQDNLSVSSENKEGSTSNETWTGWAWSYVAAVLPTQWDDDPDNQQQFTHSGHIMQFGFYVDDASLTFKVSETSHEKGYYNQKKIRYHPLLTLQLAGIYSETILVGRIWSNLTFGISEILLIPVGPCSCSHPEPGDTFPYLVIGSKANNHKCNSLFDPDAIENSGSKQYRTYNTVWDFHIFTNRDVVLLERTPALVFDYIYQMEPPEDTTSDILSDLGSNLEYSNMAEKACNRIYFGSLKFRVCSGFFHRTDSLKVATTTYDYPPYYLPKPDPSLHDLLPPSEEDFDALNEFIPTRTTKIMFFDPIVELYFMDHPFFEPSKEVLFKRAKKVSAATTPSIELHKLPKLTIECKSIELDFCNPMYINRLIHTTCQLPEPPDKMFAACFSILDINIIGLCSRLILKENNCTNLIIPFNVSCQRKSIISPQYWVKSDVAHVQTSFQLENLTFNCTKPKLIVVSHLITNLFKRNTDGLQSLRYTSLLYDACKDYHMPYLELYIEGIRFKKNETVSTITIDIALDCIKAFVFESNENYDLQMNTIQQVLFLSGPEPKNKGSNTSVVGNLPLFITTIQYPIKPDFQTHSSLVIFNLQEINVCVDPLVCKWLIYHPLDIAVHKNEERQHVRNVGFSDIYSSVSETPRRTTFIESVHSSSDRDALTVTHQKLPTIEEVEAVDLQEQIYNFLKKWHPVWKCMILSGQISQCVIYFPMASISSVGTQGIEDAIKEALRRKLVNNVMVITLPMANISSAQKQSVIKYLHQIPIKLPESIWSLNHSSFPWSVSITDLNYFAMESEIEVSFLKSVGVSATIGLSTKQESKDFNASIGGSIGVYVHIDVTPILISVSEAQMYLLANLMYELSDFVNSLTPKKREAEKTQQVSEALPSIVSIASPSISPTAKDNTLDDTSGTIPCSDYLATSTNQENVKLTAWIQWTITKFSMELLSHEFNNSQAKLVIDIEDIVSSLDYQNVYLKLKKKIGSISIRHYIRPNEQSKWSRGPFSGTVMRLREDVALEKRPEDGGFLGITITRASSQHTHNLWGTARKSKEKRLPQITTSRYLTEIVISVQPIDVILSMKNLLGFYKIFVPFFDGSKTLSSASENNKTLFSNQNLPLAYLECREIRVLVPSTELLGISTCHDVIILQVEKISFSPSATNPICRTPIRPDIYRQAAQARILTIPGSELEERQYQLDIVGLSVSTSTWKDLEQVLNIRGNFNVSENPALEWNNLKQGKLTIAPTLNISQVIEKFDITIVAAPAMIYRNDIFICNSSFEINFVTDIVISISLDQLKLGASLYNEFILPIAVPMSNHPEIKYPFTKFENLNNDLEAELTEFYKDSGIDTSEIRSILSAKSTAQPIKEPQKTIRHNPLEILFTAGKISCCLYQTSLTSRLQRIRSKYVDEDDCNYEASEEESVDEAVRNHKKYYPLLFIFLSQPNIYLSSQSYPNSTHLSCFDFSIKLNNDKNETVSVTPTIKDFPIDFVKTLTGYPDTVTGILPAFFTLKYVKEYGKNASYFIEFSRPTKISCSVAKVARLVSLKQKISENLLLDITSEVSNKPSQLKFRQIKERFRGIEMVQFKTEQLVLALETSHNLEANFVLNRTTSRLFLADRPEKINLFTTLECITFALINENVKKLLLNPWTVTAESSALLESWQSADSEPQMHVSVDSDCLMIDISPEQLVWLDKILKELAEFGNSFISQSTTNYELISKEALPEKDQHYKDDLRAGAFQFIEASNTGGDELPLPYQVMFWNSKDLCAMAWRYPQPRALIKVRIFPVPLEISFDEEPSQVSCILQYWSDHHCSYISYANFNLSESDVCYLDLPKEEPERAVAYIWRVILKSFNNDGNKIQNSIISPRVLAACMRIDSYFNKSIVPTFTMVVYVSKLELSLISTFEQKDAQLPTCLKNFSSDQAFLKTHCFFRTSATNIKYHMASWDWVMLNIDLSAMVKCSTLDYTYLTEQCILEPFIFKSEVNLAKKLGVSFVSKPIQIVIGPTITHTLTVNSQLWSQVKKIPEEKEFVVFTRYVICNDTNINLRFGQVSTDEDILLPSRCFHLYCWRSQKFKRKLKVAFAERGWLWSKPFKIDEEGIQAVALTLDLNLSVTVIIKTLSSTQKQITIAGQFVIANMLEGHFEFKIFPEAKDDCEIKKAQVHVLSGKNITPSMFIDHTTNFYFRLRFFGLESAWTGDIPLKEHTRGAQPWLVKVPLQERGQFLSIWCRIVVEDYHKCKRILAMLWPLFMVKSNFPIGANIRIDTPSMNVHLDSEVKGKGELEQLYCPGTIYHSHELYFKTEDDTSTSNSYIPLYYSLVDQQKFFKKSDKENIEDILNSLQVYDVSKWPYFGEDLENVDWVVDNQPQTTLQVRYQNASPYSSALLVEFLPWCLVANTFGCPISVMVNGIELCRIPQYGIVAPPKLDNNFHLGLDLGGGLFYSSALHLSISDWSQTFYMPKITGTLPIDGTIKTVVRCGQDIAMISITSSLTNEIRLLKLSSTHILSNYLTNQIQVVCFAVPDNGNTFAIPENADQFSFSIAPQSDKTNSGISIIRWHTLDSSTDNTNYILFISFSFQSELGWSCPVRVDDNITRKSISLKAANDQPVSLALISNERKEQVFLSLYHDDCPQTLIDNRIDVSLYCGQFSNERLVVPESKHFDWYTQIEAGKSIYYTMPFVCEKFPELQQNSFNEKVVFALSREGEKTYNWSTPIGLLCDSEQYVKIPKFGDVKILVKVTSYTSLVTINSVNEVEFSALDIRGRLSRCLEVENLVEPSTSDNCRIESHSSLNLSQISLYKSLFIPTIPRQNDWTSVEILVYVKSFSVGFLQDYSSGTERHSIANFTIDGLGIEMNQKEYLDLQIYIFDLQFDNELYQKESYDFPVVLVSQEPKPTNKANVLEISPRTLLEKTRDSPVLTLDLIIESWLNRFCNKRKTGVKDVKLKLNPTSLYIEDTYINKLVDYFNHLFPKNLVIVDKHVVKRRIRNGVEVNVPEIVFFESSVAAKPMSLKSITIENLSLLLSVHSSMKMYIALDQSPLQFAKFGRKLILTTPYRFGHAMTMHYLSGAIFAGWVVSSLELLGSPSGLARAMGMGLRDFINLPYRGFIQGPWGFITGVTHGSASLMKHVTAGTLQSVTKLASSVARNLDRLTLDEEHLRRTEEQRRMKPQGVTQGFMLGLTGLGISLLGAGGIGGIAHHTLQSLMAEGPSPRSLAAGVGLGLVGVFTKLLSGAAELVALAGQGLLQGAGWNPLPQPRSSLLESISPLDQTSSIKYEWKLLNAISHKKILYVTEATIVTNTDFKGIVLILTSDALIIVNIDDDTVRRIISLGQLTVSASDKDPTYLIFKIVKMIEEENIVEMDPACRARVADYVKSTATILNINREEEAEMTPTNPMQNNTDDQFGCYVNPQNRNYFVCLFLLAKQLNNDYSFPVL